MLRLRFIRPCIALFLLLAALVSGLCDCTAKVGKKTIGNAYNSTQSTDAVNEAKRLDTAKQQVGLGVKNPYPHYFGNGEGLAFTVAGCVKPNLREFPILVGSLYSNASKSQGADRVVYTKSGTFCGCMTHTNAPNASSFILCH
ncbi:Ribonuclease/ribotoxin [Pleurotus eryngii]|uniref:Ribonuclease/ribotoxin n=1 Tax=Pleurotus eryngii TaxID=5323 RepID=A0A9P6DEY8_PLEER|nr:Ribonuclease/ribotoxin [Pleurotus eryngii]